MSLLSEVIVEKNFYKEKIESARKSLGVLAIKMDGVRERHDLEELDQLLKELDEIETELYARPPGDSDAPV